MTKKSSEAKIRAAAKYDKANTKSVFLKFNLKTDADILAHLETVGNKQGFIKELIRQSIHQNIIVNTKQIISGDFKEGEYVTVRVEGNVYERKVQYSKEKGDLFITIKRKEYLYSEFNEKD